MPVPAADAKKMNLPIRIIAGIVGLLVIAVGITQMRSGVSELTGGTSAAVTTMLAEIETAVNAANANTVTATPLFQLLLARVDSFGVSAAHRDQQEAARSVAALFDSSAAHFRRASTVSDSAGKLESRDAQKRFLQAKAEAYTHFAETAELNREIVGLVMDESITTMEELAPKITDAGQRRDAAQAAGLAAQERANVIAKELAN